MEQIIAQRLLLRHCCYGTDSTAEFCCYGTGSDAGSGLGVGSVSVITSSVSIIISLITAVI